jgi:NAD(P)-dependent dehydrogenase (short-subunit alcohol dehydrogenase family)
MNEIPNNPLKKWILITGASSGIGKATAEVLSEHGFGIYAGIRTQQHADQFKSNSNIIPLFLDVTKPLEVDTAFKEIDARGTGLFGLINNAGIAKAGALMDISDEDMREQFEVNVFGVHRITRKFLPLLQKSKGRIVMISSDSGFFATPFFGPYCASKFAIEGYSDSLRRELQLFDIKVIIIQPGRITTPIWDKGEDTLKKGEVEWKDSPMFQIGKKIGEYAIRKGKTEGMDPREVGKIILKALTIEQPRLRYLVANNKNKYRMIKLLPARSIDQMLKKELTKKE